MSAEYMWIHPPSRLTRHVGSSCQQGAPNRLPSQHAKPSKLILRSGQRRIATSAVISISRVAGRHEAAWTSAGTVPDDLRHRLDCDARHSSARALRSVMSEKVLPATKLPFANRTSLSTLPLV